jgi:transposase
MKRPRWKPEQKALIVTRASSSRLNGIEPLAWLTNVLERVISGPAKAHELERLLPWTWEVERLAAAGNA